jgi:ATP-dependent Clp protease ATP-binding subunit ClpA
MFERYSERARRVIFTALWSARRRGALYIETEDLLHAMIRYDRGEFPAISAELFPGAPAHHEDSAESRQPFFSGGVAKNLLRELHEDPDPVSTAPRGEKLEATPESDMPVSHSLQKVFYLVAQARQADTKTVEPLDMLAAIVDDQDTRMAQLLREHGITPKKVAGALDSES